MTLKTDGFSVAGRMWTMAQQTWYRNIRTCDMLCQTGWTSIILCWQPDGWHYQMTLIWFTYWVVR